MVGRDSSGELEFGQVCAIYADGQEVLFEFTLMVTEEFALHSHSFVLSSSSSSPSYLIKHEDLLDYHPYGLYFVFATHHVVLRNNVYV